MPTQEGKSPDYLLAEPDWQKLSPKELAENIIDRGFVTHSFNGYNLKSVKRFGLGDGRVYDDELGQDFDFICSVLGEGEYTGNQGGGKDEIYYTSPGAKTFHYACGYSPERLWLGPLKQDRKNALPIILGESKEQYALRVLEEKINSLDSLVSFETKQELLARGTRLIKKLCSHKPVVALIPINSKKYKLTAYHSTTRRQEDKLPLLTDLLDKGTGSYSRENIQSFFTENTNLIEFNNLGNLVHAGGIPPSELQFLETEDAFSLMQRKAILMGMEKGDEIDYFSGEKCQPKQEIEEEDKTPQEEIVIDKGRIEEKIEISIEEDEIELE